MSNGFKKISFLLFAFGFLTAGFFAHSHSQWLPLAPYLTDGYCAYTHSSICHTPSGSCTKFRTVQGGFSGCVELPPFWGCIEIPSPVLYVLNECYPNGTSCSCNHQLFQNGFYVGNSYEFGTIY